LALGDLNEKQLLGLTAGVVGAVLLVMAGILFWTYTRYKGLLDDIKAKTARAETMEDEARGLDEVKERYDAWMNRRYETLRQVPEEDQTTDLNAQISKQAASAKLRILRIERIKEKTSRGRGKSKQKTGKLGEIGIHIEAAGSFNSFGQFLNNIEEVMDRFIAVTGFTITAYEDGLDPGKGAHEITLDLVAYKYAGDKKKPAAARGATAAGR